MSPDLQCTGDSAAAPVHSLDSPRVLVEAFRHALSEADLSEKAASYQMDIDPSQLSRALRGDGHLYLDRFPALGPRFQRAFIAAWADALGLRVVSRDATKDNLRRITHTLMDLLATLEER
jgi:hypothetical protein